MNKPSADELEVALTAVPRDEEIARLTAERDEVISELMASLADEPGKRGYVHVGYCNNSRPDVMPGTRGVSCNCHPKLRAQAVASDLKLFSEADALAILKRR